MSGRKPRPKGSGRVRRMDSGRWQARFKGDDGVLRPAPHTFDTKGAADAWLARQGKLLAAGAWTPPAPVVVSSLRAYADDWLAHRDLKPRTASHYRWLLDAHVLPALGSLPLEALTPFTIRRWYEETAPGRAATRAHAYGLLRTILHTAVTDGLLTANPAAIRGAGSSRRASQTKVLTPAELSALAEAMPPRLQAMVLLAGWCALRFGELAELRRGDVDTTAGVIRVRRAVVRVNGVALVGPPKSEAGIRDVSIPPHLLPTLEHHLQAHTGASAGSLLFPAHSGAHLATATLYGPFYKARKAIGRDDLRFHDLRHTGAVLAAQVGATLAELQARLGHSTVHAAMRYQHAAVDRDRLIAERLSGLA